MKTFPLLAISLIIMLQAIFHLFRFLWDVPMTIGTFLLPGWTGGLLFIAFGLVASWAFQALFTLSRPPHP